MAKRVKRHRPVEVSQRILVIRGQRVLLDTDLAALYGVAVKRLNEQVARNQAKFPADFMFRLEFSELGILRSQVATSSWGGRRYRQIAFTEHGAIMAATVLNSPRAVHMTVYVVRAFVKLREALASNVELARKLAALEKSVANLDSRTRRQFEHVYAAIRLLMARPDPPSRPIGFTANFTRE